jgi:hypothetical protein
MEAPIIVQVDDEFNTMQFWAFCEEHGTYYFFWKPFENPKNQFVEVQTRLSRDS